MRSGARSGARPCRLDHPDFGRQCYDTLTTDPVEKAQNARPIVGDVHLALPVDKKRCISAAEVLDQSPRKVDRCVDLNSTNRDALDVDADGDSQAPAI